MGILGIANRTENWKTVRHFFRPSMEVRVGLIRRLCGDEVPASEIKLELFWYGVRDYIQAYMDCHGADRDKDEVKRILEERFSDHYFGGFSNLREDIRKRGYGLQVSQPRNYSPTNQEDKSKLYTNLQNTEVDIVLETPGHLFIGEAKNESDLGANPDLVLVHQLIRQYVMARILVELKESDKKVVPFVVVNSTKLKTVKNKAQVKFMIDQCWLKGCNILSWDCIKQLDQ